MATRWGRRPMTTAVLATLLAVALAGCGRSGGPERDPGTTGTPTTRLAASTSAPADPAKAVLAAYLRFWQLWLEDNDPPNPDDPRLAVVETGDQLTGTRSAIRNNLRNGLVIKLPAHSVSRDDATVELTAPDMAVVTDCSIDDSMEVVVKTGQVINGTVQTILIKSDMALVGGAWKVSYSRFVHTWEGQVACAG